MAVFKINYLESKFISFFFQLWFFVHGWLTWAEESSEEEEHTETLADDAHTHLLPHSSTYDQQFHPAEQANICTNNGNYLNSSSEDCLHTNFFSNNCSSDDDFHNSDDSNTGIAMGDNPVAFWESRFS